MIVLLLAVVGLAVAATALSIELFRQAAAQRPLLLPPVRTTVADPAVRRLAIPIPMFFPGPDGSTETVIAEADITPEVAGRAVTVVNNTVRAAHLGIADIPFGVLDSIPGVRVPSAAVRAVHHGIAEGVYGTIGAVASIVARESQAREGQARGTHSRENNQKGA